jgi:zinc protease
VAPTCTASIEKALPFLPEKAIHQIYDNGYQLVFVPKRGDVFNINTWVSTGSIHEDEQNNGVSHFLEHLMFKGTERFQPGEFDRAMEGMGGIINAATWKDFTFYYITGPKGEGGENFKQALDMHADMLLHSTLPDDEIGAPYDYKSNDPNLVKRERAVVIEEIGMRGDQPWTKVFNGVNHLMYPEGHPYQRDVIGTREIISQIPRADIESYYHRWYSSAAMTTIVVGDFDFNWLEEQVLSCFDFDAAKRVSTGQPVNYQDTSSTLDTFTPANRLHVETADVQTAFVMLGFHGPKACDLKASIALDIVHQVLGDGRSSRLYQTFVEKPANPVFNALSSGQSHYRLGNVTYIQGNLNVREEGEAKTHVDAVLAELNALLTTRPITNDEFERARKLLRSQFAETSESASGLADEIGESFTLMGTMDGYANYLEVLNALDRQTVQTIAAEWLQPKDHFLAILLPKQSQ